MRELQLPDADICVSQQSRPVGPERLRVKCILELPVTSGIRLNELAKAIARKLSAICCGAGRS